MAVKRIFLPYEEKTKKKVGILRKEQTPAEQKLWFVLRENRKTINLKFRRQHPIGPYIADFYCIEQKCVIEVDGSSHDSSIERDKQRDAYMQKLGIKVFRFPDRDVQNDPYMVIETVLNNLGFSRP